MNEITLWDIIIFTDFDIQFNVQLHCGTVGLNNILTLFFMKNLVYFQLILYD